MLQVLVILLVILIVTMIVSVIIANKKLIRNRESVVQLISVAILTACCYTVFILVPSGYVHLAAFTGGLYFLTTDWLVVSLMLFVAGYTNVRPFSKLSRYSVYLLMCVDSISFLVNAFTRHMFELERKADSRLGIGYWAVQLKFPHVLHRVFVYSLVLYSLGVLLYKVFTAPGIYKKKYGTILIQTLAVVGLNILCSALNARYDYSVILYASLAISICYLALYSLPRKVLEKIHSIIVGDSVVGLFAYDNNGKCIGVNQMAEELFEGRGDIYDVAVQYLTDWMEEHDGNLSDIMEAERTVVRNGEKKYIYVTYQKFLDKKKRYLGCCFQFEDRTEMVLQYKEEQYRATHDMLTGLLNREAFEVEVRKILAQAEEPYYIVNSNIKDFKLINELYGTDVGDRLLITQANMIRQEEREGSVNCRVYADKFCTLLPKSHFDEQQFIENMTATMERCLATSFKLHYYLGVYEITDANEPVWTMYDKAMMAIDAIRGNYEQTVCFYREEFLQRILREKEVLGEFDRALEEAQFSMFLQPQIANNGKIVGAEALVRWIHPEKGVISPMVFIPTLEKAGLIHKLDLFMWESAAKKLEEWKKQGREDLSISVNISTKDFYYLDICEAMRSLSERYDFNIKNLKLEITESALMENVREVMRTLDGLHGLGYDIEIDDFGSGYSSLGMLKDINADILKIDMIFLQETKNIKKSTTIIKNIIYMSKELGMPVITEGVETQEQMEFLTDAGCDMFQGYYFAKPMNVADFEKEYCADVAV